MKSSIFFQQLKLCSQSESSFEAHIGKHRIGGIQKIMRAWNETLLDWSKHLFGRDNFWS